jgi:hypothetical protein
MFDYLTQLLFSNPEDEGEEMDNLDEDPVDEDIVSDDSNCESGDDEEEEYKDDYSEYFPDSESEEELCCKAVMSKLILYGTDHTLKAMWRLIKNDCREKGIKIAPKYVAHCTRNDKIKCECFRESGNEDDTPADKTSEAKAEEKLSNSV